MHGLGGNLDHFHPMLGIGYWVLGFVWGSSAGEKDNFIKVRCVTRLLGNFNMTTMDGIETTSEECNFLFQGGLGGFGYVTRAGLLCFH